MCGIAGIFRHRREVPVDAALVRAMGDAIAHRGPDGSGMRVGLRADGTSGAGYGLAHRRLAIVDLASGQQPMSDASGTCWVTFNGEIYNWQEVRAELETLGHRFHTRCDTEVLVEGWRAWGTALPEKLRGMFAFAIVDEPRHVLFLARDRIGKKPLYWLREDGGLGEGGGYGGHGEGGGLRFASEPKALLVDPALPRRIEPRALAQFLCLRYVPDPLTIFQGIEKLPPGHWLLAENGQVRTAPYWRLSFAAPRTQASVDELEEEVRALLDEAVRIRLMGDVPLGAFLSGGLDSHAVVDSMARAARAGSRAAGGSGSGSGSGAAGVVACTIGFADGAFDERPHARAAAASCGAVLHEGVVGAEDLLDLSWFADTFDEPFADSSAIPTYHVSRIARRHVTVALSGDGGDESFAGYRRYRFDWLESRARGLAPRALWRLLGALYPKVDFLPRWLRGKRVLQELGSAPDEAYARSVAASMPEEVVPLLRRAPEEDPLAPVRRAHVASDGPDALARAAATDFATYLPGDILVKVDRASMAVSLEVRAPLLDHRLVEAAARIPSALKLAGGETKAFLRRALRARLGDAAAQRRKQGFSVPLRRWLQGPLAPELERTLRSERLNAWLDGSRLLPLLQRHRAGTHDHGEVLWAALVLERFLRRWVP